MAVAMLLTLDETTKRLTWTARPDVVQGENEVTTVTVTWPASLAGWAKYLDFQTYNNFNVIVDGVTTAVQKVRVPYTDAYPLPVALVRAKISVVQAVAHGPSGEVFVSMSAEFPVTKIGIEGLAGIVPPVDTITTAEVDPETGHLILTRADLTTIDAGSVIGPIGPDGLPLEYDWDGTSLGVRVQGDAEYQYVDLKGAQGDTGAGLEFDWDGTQLGVRVEGETEYQYVELKGDKGDAGATGATGATGAQGPQGIQGPAGADGTAAVTEHINNASAAHAASAISIADAGSYFTASPKTAESIAQELALNSRGVVVADVTLDGAWVDGASADAGADTITVVSATGLANGTPIEFRANTGALPAGITDYLNGAKGVGDGDYFNIINLSGTSFQICDTVGGTTPINITDAGTAGWQWRVAGATTLAVTGLDLDKHKEYEIYMQVSLAKITTAVLQVYSTTTGYSWTGFATTWPRTFFSWLQTPNITGKYSMGAYNGSLRLLGTGLLQAKSQSSAAHTNDRSTATVTATIANNAVGTGSGNITGFTVVRSVADVGLIRNGSRVIVVRRGA